jgi:hypothetical protein
MGRDESQHEVVGEGEGEIDRDEARISTAGDGRDHQRLNFSQQREMRRSQKGVQREK